jgi:hypothetical protein
LMISYTLVSLINTPQVMAVECGTTDRDRAGMDGRRGGLPRSEVCGGYRRSH